MQNPPGDFAAECLAITVSDSRCVANLLIPSSLLFGISKRAAPWQKHLLQNRYDLSLLVYFRKAGESRGRHAIFNTSNQTMLNIPAVMQSTTSDACSLENRNSA